MSFVYVAVAVVVGLIILFVMGSKADKEEQKLAVEKLALAKEAHARGDGESVKKAIAEGLYVSVDYDKETGAVALEMFRLYRAVAPEGVGPFEALEAFFERAAKTGEFDDKAEPLVKAFKAHINGESGALDSMIEQSHGDYAYVDGSETTDSETDVINQVGKKLVFGSLEDVLALVTPHLEGSPSAAFKTALLNQRGAAYCMAERYAEARADYEECTRLQPGDPTHQLNLAEMCEKLGDKPAAESAARQVLSVPSSKRDKKNAERIARWAAG